MCGCAFPCNLTFKGPMLNMIHQLLGNDIVRVISVVNNVLLSGVGVPPGMRQITVCHKHSDLLKQARDKCFSTRDAKKRTVVKKTSGDISLVLENTAASSDHPQFNMSSSDQKIVDKFVYQAEETGEGGIILQEVDTSDKMVKLNLSDVEGYMSHMTHVQTDKQTEEELEQTLELELEGREERLEQQLEHEAAGVEEKHDLDHIPVVSVSDASPVTIIAPEYAAPVSYHVPSSAVATIPYHEPTSKPVVLTPVNKRHLIIPDTAQTRDHSPVLKIQFREYNTRVLNHELGQLVSNSDLGDTLLVCGDGKVVTSSLLLAPVMPWLTSILDSLIRIDQFKTVIMPTGVSVVAVSLLLNLICSKTVPALNSVELQILEDICSTLQCSSIYHMVNRDQSQLQNRKRKYGVSSPRKANILKKPRLPEQQNQDSTATAAQSDNSNVKVEKRDLNPDYIDNTGLVRLSSVDEMALHYCIMCDKKFKKYNQAITHYDAEHNLKAALACDMCDETFLDVFNCTKHKHEKHGLFDENFQCYICKEVLYSRFRLNSHIKDMHKEYHGEHMCKACGMKFAAKYYLTNHEREKHSENSNVCNFCDKSFSGKRYLTMHIKASHSNSPLRKERLKCEKCDLKFTSQKERNLHIQRQHISTIKN